MIRRSLAGKTRTALIAGFAGLAVAAIVGVFTTTTGRYYAQAVVGHAELMLAREPIAEVLQRPATEPELEQRLVTARAIRDFASDQLALPDNDSYRSYVDVGRDQLLWNVTAVPEFSLAPKEWCYPIVGCQSYRGYFRETRARTVEQELETMGYVASVRPVSAYSTLGIFTDPLTSTMLQRDDSGLAELIFHELAHQQVFIGGDTMFNESYANFVGEQGVREYLRSRGEHEVLARWERRRQQAHRFQRLLADTRAELKELYDRQLPPAEMRQHKRTIIRNMEQRFSTELVADTPAMRRFAEWFEQPVTNARLAHVALYQHWHKAFAELYRQHDRDWRAFHAAVEDLADLSKSRRTAQLEELRTHNLAQTAHENRDTTTAAEGGT